MQVVIEYVARLATPTNLGTPRAFLSNKVIAVDRSRADQRIGTLFIVFALSDRNPYSIT